MFIKMFTCVTIEQYGGSVHPAATGKDAPARNVGAIEGSSPLLLFLLSPPPLTHSLFLFPSILPSFSISLSRRTASGLVGVRTTDRDRICVVPLHPSGVTAGCGRAGIIAGSLAEFGVGRRSAGRVT